MGLKQSLADLAVDLVKAFSEVPQLTVDSASSPCVRNITTPVLQDVTSPTLGALCGGPADKERILGEIKDCPEAPRGYKDVDNAIASTTKANKMDLLQIGLRISLLVGCKDAAMAGIVGRVDFPLLPHAYVVGCGFGAILSSWVLVYVMAQVLFDTRGVVRCRDLGKVALVQAVVGWPFFLLGLGIGGAAEPLQDAPKYLSFIAGFAFYFGASLISQGVVVPMGLVAWGACLKHVHNYFVRRCFALTGHRLDEALLYGPWLFLMFLNVINIFSTFEAGEWYPRIVFDSLFYFGAVLTYMYAVSLLVHWGIVFDFSDCPCCCSCQGNGRRVANMDMAHVRSFLVKGPSDHQFYDFRMLDTSPMGVCMDAFCRRFRLKESEVAFVANGKPVLPDDTVASLGIENDEKKTVVSCTLIDRCTSSA